MPTLKDSTSKYISQNLPYWTAKIIRQTVYAVVQLFHFLGELIHDFLGR